MVAGPFWCSPFDLKAAPTTLMRQVCIDTKSEYSNVCTVARDILLNAFSVRLEYRQIVSWVFMLLPAHGNLNHALLGYKVILFY